MSGQAGKGSVYRPVNMQEYGERHSRIDFTSWREEREREKAEKRRRALELENSPGGPENPERSPK